MARKQELESHPAGKVKEVNFYQLMRSIEREAGLQLGGDLKYQQEPVILRADPDAQFPATEVAYWNSQQEPPEVIVSFFGLFGPSGALPQHYTQLLADRARIKDYALRDFLDMFNHRLLSFFYRCWEKHQFPIAYETSRAADREDRVTGALRGLVGLRTEGLWDRLSVPSSDFLFFSGHFANQRPTASAIRSMIQSAFNVPAQVEQFVGQWMYVPIAEQTRLGSHPLGFSIGNQLGVEAFAGQRVRDFENKFRVRIGPLGFNRFLEFNPDRPKLRQIFDYIRLYVGPQYDVDLQVILKRDEVKTTQLGNRQTANLGWNTWLGDWTKPHDAADAVFQLPDVI
ncbi:MAG: type VI secretion system baseplate subunit TssG [Pirellulaceae bacterium]|nr:type VI secretion system baseplate subunit TssG [Pirellulaceae bacterium]